MAEKTPFLETVDQIREDNEQRAAAPDSTKQELGDHAIMLLAIQSAEQSAS